MGKPNPYKHMQPRTEDFWREVSKGKPPVIEPKRHPESQAFKDTLDAMLLLHDRKQKDYGTKESPFANLEASEMFGIPAWIGIAIRSNDKMRRISTATQQWLETGSVQLSNESLDDSWIDLAVYAVVGYLKTQQWNSK
jgi:hypothetical protein